jgi:hypothetical protein
MRSTRRGGHHGVEFGGSGEDSFVAVVVTKLTGALLFILLLTMVIMALLPKAIDLPSPGKSEPNDAIPLAIATPSTLPEGISGRPYTVALAAVGGSGSLRWGLDGTLPEGMRFDPKTAQIQGTPRAGTPKPVELVLRVSDGNDRAAKPATLVVYQPDRPLTVPSKWLPKLPPLPIRSWIEQGFGFVVLLLVHMVGMNTLRSLERWSAGAGDKDESATVIRRGRFIIYRTALRLATLGAMIALAVWMTQTHTRL